MHRRQARNSLNTLYQSYAAAKPRFSEPCLNCHSYGAVLTGVIDGAPDETDDADDVGDDDDETHERCGRRGKDGERRRWLWLNRKSGIE